MKEYTAFDIGGSYIKYGMVTEQGELREQDKMKTPDSLDVLMQHITDIVHRHPDSAGIAVSAPGAVADEGVIYGISALSYLHGPNIKHRLEEKTGLPVFMENDGNCAGAAELWKGTAKGKQDVLTVVIGTGIGGSVIKEGQTHKGASLHGGEFGFMLLGNPDTGRLESWSQLAATRALTRYAEAEKEIEPDTLTGEQVFEWADEGDPACVKALDRFYRFLALGLYNLQYIYDPELILLGGGVSARKELVQRINKKLDELMREAPVGTIRPTLDVCHFRQHANLLGAVYRFMQQTEAANR
ncbi:ROK family protein [Salibacterium halotolerans]|uniref:Sugar kinase of the NBD/HSP70 family, may contain an N-terminal HTH domain n=1 Tax=Salibacterium halotolerans TaxID=1884432 RepID=A0A1I5LFG0_9BACI|nr:ROK family protein [Salibacterium halotolerans]SFO95461.1 Sugar kinase of the NBD/HSP70 family, may contain an N-terminal HTH domain [Salibacterium halotolerans]